LLSPAMRRQGFAQNEIVTRWRDVVGPLLAARSLPEKLRFTGDSRGDGTLFVRVDGSFALEFQHLSPQILERVNTFFGYRAVARLVLRQGPLPRAPGRPSAVEPALPAEVEAALQADLAALRPGPIRDALMRLGRRLLAGAEHG
jgi:hypothetical protein